MTRWAMIRDLDKCVACQACIVACRVENSVPIAGPVEAERGRAMFWNEMLAHVEGEFPNVHLHLVPRNCMQCENPPCVKVCPVGATWKNAEGVVEIDQDICIGCRYCVVACPYGARSFNWYTPEFVETHANYVNPDAPPRPRGTVEKCTYCSHRIQQARAEGKPIGSDYENGVVPACAQTCPGSAILFGDLDDPNSIVARLAHSHRATRLLEELGTEPKTIYLQEA
ncbi:MAG: 4Fe-4S dicluster domain-containing protein [Anaerolineae bacterium]